MTRQRSSDTEGVMYLLLDVLLVLLGASMLWYRERLARCIARVQQNQSRAWPWAYPGIIGRFYTSEKAWRNVFIPILAVAFLCVSVLWLWKGAY
jgi:predicted membrane protein